MNFKIYLEKGLKRYISGIDSYPYFSFTEKNYKEKINSSIASKVSQSFLLFIYPESIGFLHSYLSEFNGIHYQFVILGSIVDKDDDFPLDHMMAFTKDFITETEFSWFLKKFDNCIRREIINDNLSDPQAKDYISDQYELISIGQMLAEERDRDELIRKILMTSIKITGCDAGCVFLVVDREDGSKGLLFKYSYTFSRNIDFNEYIMPLDESSISGFCAINDEVVNIPDVYNINEDATFSFNSSIDELYDYVSRSMLVIPMKNHMGEILGVIELINSKEHYDINNNSEIESHRIKLETRDDFFDKVFPFAARYEDIMLSVAGQASIALDNIKILKQLEDQFEGMVRASVDAIDSKDPATSGHSFRIAQMGVRFLDILNEVTKGEFKDLTFAPQAIKQMEYAALLHDYGKVYINNEIFLKAKKLFPKDSNILRLRLELIIQILLGKNNTESTKKAYEVRRIKNLVFKLNEPNLLVKDPREAIDDILKFNDKFKIYDDDGNLLPILTGDEVINLQIAKGTLNNDERKEIESHVIYSYKFLQSIPWPKELSRIPEIAGAHHEKLDGSGYPNHLKGDEISLESRILTILDIFDALSAPDRPYKKAVPLERVESIMMEEGDLGKLDSRLLKIFFSEKIYEGLYSRDSDSILV